MNPSKASKAVRLQTDSQRRVLAHLPRYYSDSDHAKAEAHERKANRYAEDWELERSMTLTKLCKRLDDDVEPKAEGNPDLSVKVAAGDPDGDHAPAIDVTADDSDAALEVLGQLKDLGFVERTVDGRWAMTEAGFDALQTLSDPEQRAHEAALKAIAAEQGGN